MNGIYAVVKRYTVYEDDNNTVKVDFKDWYFKTNDYYEIYNRLMEITDNEHEISASGASWCELACIGEIYEFREGEIEIQEIE